MWNALLIAALVAFVAATVSPLRSQTASSNYVGSQSCRRCHAPTYERWSKTRMANVVRDPKEHPEAVLPDFSKPDPLLTFTLDRRRVRLRQQMEAAVLHDGRRTTTSRCRRSGTSPIGSGGRTSSSRIPTGGCHIYPADNMKRPTGPLCDGCHSVNYDIQNEDGDRVERRLRTLPRTRERARAAAEPRATSSTPRSSISCAPTTRASSATRRASR